MQACMSLFRAACRLSVVCVCVAVVPRPRPRPHTHPGHHLVRNGRDHRCQSHFVHAAVGNRRDPLGSLWAFLSASILPTRGRARCCVVPYLRICFGECLYLVALPTAYFFLSVSPIGAHFSAVSFRPVLRLFVVPGSDVNRSLVDLIDYFKNASSALGRSLH